MKFRRQSQQDEDPGREKEKLKMVPLLRQQEVTVSTHTRDLRRQARPGRKDTESLFVELQRLKGIFSCRGF